MNTRINIAEILRSYPRGTELFCSCFSEVRFDHVDDKGRIRCLCGDTDDEVSFTAYGTINLSPMAKVVISLEDRWENLMIQEDRYFAQSDRVVHTLSGPNADKVLCEIFLLGRDVINFREEWLPIDSVRKMQQITVEQYEDIKDKIIWYCNSLQALISRTIQS